MCIRDSTRTLSGQKVTYHCKLPGQEESFELSELDASIYTDVEALRSELLQNASDGINRIINAAKNMAKQQFSPGPEVITSNTMENTIVNETLSDEDVIRVDLGNGQVGILRQG